VAIQKFEWDLEELCTKTSEILKEWKAMHTVVIIDEIDTFASQEKAFMFFVQMMLKVDTNTSLVGIANSVDLPFKKHSALALREKQLLFQPYTKD